MKKIIIDCDNTFGIEGCDIDDGLAIIYALGSGKCEVLGITTTFGNNNIDVVYPNTVQFMKNINHADIPVLKGSEKDADNNEAAKFLVESVSRFPNEISILVTGSLTNLYHACHLDISFYNKVSGISIMGGITEPLIMGGKVLDELNLSCHYEASFHVLTHAKFIKIATGNNCLDALFEKTEFDYLRHIDSEFIQWLYHNCQYWFNREVDMFGHEGIYKWDVYAAAMLLNPQLFEHVETEITPDTDSLKNGSLLGSGKPMKVKLPKIKNIDEYRQHVYDTYIKFSRI